MDLAIAAPFPATISKLYLPPRLRRTNLAGIVCLLDDGVGRRPNVIRDSTITFRRDQRITSTRGSAPGSRRSPQWEPHEKTAPAANAGRDDENCLVHNGFRDSIRALRDIARLAGPLFRQHPRT
jgi:hypothetical protein